MKTPDSARPADGIAWVTGASQGIGKAVAERLVKEGWTVAISARSADKLEAMAEGSEGRMIALPCDVTDEDQVAQAAARIEEAHGPIALAILNAGTYEPDTADDFAFQRFAKHVDLNLLGTARCVNAVMPRMIERKKGHLAIVASVAGYRGLPRSVSYSSTKSALIAMAEALKFDLDRLGIKIQIINPGFVRTPLTDKNDFEMPMLMEVDDAAEELVKGLARRDFEISFPLAFTGILKQLRRLPYGLYFPAMRKVTGL